MANKTIRVGSAGYQEGVFRFALVIDLARTGEHGPERISSNMIEMSFGLESSTVIKNNGELNFFIKKIEFGGESFADFDPYAFLSNPPPWVIARGERPRVAFLPISVRLHDRLIAYARGFDGFPATSSGTLGRMLYPSAVTVTTLGFGDILPISTMARTVVACEAVLGVVLIGLYLASLFNGFEGSRKG